MSSKRGKINPPQIKNLLFSRVIDDKLITVIAEDTEFLGFHADRVWLGLLLVLQPVGSNIPGCLKGDLNNLNIVGHNLWREWYGHTGSSRFLANRVIFSTGSPLKVSDYIVNPIKKCQNLLTLVTVKKNTLYLKFSGVLQKTLYIILH